MSHPDTPQTIGRNFKRYENEKMRNLQIRKENMRLIGNLDRIAREEHYPRHAPQRPFTLQGIKQKEEMARINYENRKLLQAVQERKPILNRNDWLMHKIDHDYQVAKNSEYQQTVPMSEIMRRDLNTSGYMQEPYQSSYASSARRSINTARRSTATGSKATSKSTSKAMSNTSYSRNGELEDEADDRANALLAPNNEEDEREQSHHSSRQSAHSRPSRSSRTSGQIEDIHEDKANSLLGNDDDEHADEEDAGDDEDRPVSSHSHSSHHSNHSEHSHHSEHSDHSHHSEHSEHSNHSKNEDDGELEQETNDRANALLG